MSLCGLFVSNTQTKTTEVVSRLIWVCDNIRIVPQSVLFWIESVCFNFLRESNRIMLTSECIRETSWDEAGPSSAQTGTGNLVLRHLRFVAKDIYLL